MREVWLLEKQLQVVVNYRIECNGNVCAYYKGGSRNDTMVIIMYAV